MNKVTGTLANNQLLQATSGAMALLFLWGAFKSGNMLLKVGAGAILAFVVLGVVKARG